MTPIKLSLQASLLDAVDTGIVEQLRESHVGPPLSGFVRSALSLVRAAWYAINAFPFGERDRDYFRVSPHSVLRCAAQRMEEQLHQSQKMESGWQS